MADHPYDAPSLMPREFMLAVMHDPTMPMITRIDAAARLLERWPERHHYTPPFVIRIEGLGPDVSTTKEPKVHGDHAHIQ